MVAAAGTRRDLAAVDDGDPEPSQCEVVSEAAAGGAAAHDQYVGIMSSGHSLSALTA